MEVMMAVMERWFFFLSFPLQILLPLCTTYTSTEADFVLFGDATGNQDPECILVATKNDQSFALFLSSACFNLHLSFLPK